MNNLTLKQRKWTLKSYWKHENPWDVRRRGMQNFHTDPPTRVIIYKIRDKFDTDGTVANKKKSGRNKTSSAEEDEILVALTFVISPKKSTRRASLQLSIQELLWCVWWESLNWDPIGHAYYMAFSVLLIVVILEFHYCSVIT